MGATIRILYRKYAQNSFGGGSMTSVETSGRYELQDVICPSKGGELLTNPTAVLKGQAKLIYSRQSQSAKMTSETCSFGETRSWVTGKSAGGLQKGKIELIYIDPPFDVGADFTMDVPVGDDRRKPCAEGPISLETVAYRDTWGKGTDSYVHMMYERLTRHA